jgi:hypothetical protein
MLEANPLGIEEQADWIETVCLTHVSNGIPLHAIQDFADQYADFREMQVTLALNAMKRRADVLGRLYPFHIDDLAVRVDASRAQGIYAALLFLSRTSSGTPWLGASSIAQHAELLELVTCAALKKLLGEESQAIPFGWPSKVGRPAEFQNAIPWLADLMGLEVGSGFRPPRRKDGGVDVVGWKPLGDGRSGFPISLVQCTIQQDFVSKARDIDLRLWAGWLALDRDPLTVLAIPRTVAPGPTWNEVSANSVLLERIRLTRLCGSDEIQDAKDLVVSHLGLLRSLCHVS